MIAIRTGMTIGGTSQEPISSHLSDARRKSQLRHRACPQVAWAAWITKVPQHRMTGGQNPAPLLRKVGAGFSSQPKKRFAFHSLKRQRNSAVGGLGRIEPKLMAYRVFFAPRGRLSGAERRFSVLAGKCHGVSQGPTPPCIVVAKRPFRGLPRTCSVPVHAGSAAPFSYPPAGE
jgi:hypothetical protein